LCTPRSQAHIFCWYLVIVRSQLYTKMYVCAGHKFNTISEWVILKNNIKHGTRSSQGIILGTAQGGHEWEQFFFSFFIILIFYMKLNHLIIKISWESCVSVVLICDFFNLLFRFFLISNLFAIFCCTYAVKSSPKPDFFLLGRFQTKINGLCTVLCNDLFQSPRFVKRLHIIIALSFLWISLNLFELYYRNYRTDCYDCYIFLVARYEAGNY
jgi:hypothetical protein